MKVILVQSGVARFAHVSDPISSKEKNENTENIREQETDGKGLKCADHTR
jgi:hypothetical protein